MKLPLYIVCFLLPFLSFGQQFTVSGTVTDKNTGEPLPGATVLIYKTHKGCSADFDGNYVVNAALNDTLQFSFVGMKTQKRIVTQEELHVQLEEDDQINLEFDRPYIPTQPRHTPSVRVITAKELEQSLKKLNNPRYQFKKNAKNNVFVIYVSELTSYDFNNEELEFQQKYNVKYSLIGSLKLEYVKKHNRLTFKHLSKRFKKTWVSEIRKDAVGLKNSK